MKYFRLILRAALFCTAALAAASAGPAVERDVIDLTKWTPPNIATVGDDPAGTLVKYGHALFTNTANELGPTVPDPARHERNSLRFDRLSNPFSAEPNHRHRADPRAMRIRADWKKT